MSKRDKKQVGRGEQYFAVNDKACGIRTSYRVSGKLGECAKRFCLFDDAWADRQRLNRAYELGFKHGQEANG